MTKTVAAERAPSRIGLVGLVLLLAAIAARAMVAISPEPIFDVDPLREPLSSFAIGPAGAIGLSIVMLFGSSLVLLDEVRAGRALNRLMILLAFIPLVPILEHGLTNPHALWLGMDWLAAAIGAIAFAHAARNESLRAAIIGVMLGLLGVLMLRGMVQLLHEHSATVAYFDANREAMLRSFGWQPGSVQAELYERRLRQPEATAWFGLANSLSAVVAVGTVLLAGILAFTWRQTASGTRVLLVAVALLGLTVLLVNGSKGAIGATGLGLALALVPLRVPLLREQLSGLPARIGVLALVLATVAVLARGLFGDSFLGEKSLLFRCFYMEGAWAMIRAHPLIGVGPDGFQAAWLAVKPMHSPEDPTSAHNVLFDWMSMLGVAGLAWIWLLAWLGLSSGTANEPVAPKRTSGRMLPVALLLGGAFSIAVESQMLAPPDALFRAVALLVGFAIAVSAAEGVSRIPRGAQVWVRGGAVATLLALSGLDMLFVQSGSTALAWGLIGALAVAGTAQTRRGADWMLAVWPMALALGVAWVGLLPQRTLDAQLQAAAAPLREVGFAQRDGVHNLEQERAARRSAIDKLTVAIDGAPNNRRPAIAAIDQLRAIAGISEPAEARTALLEALVRADQISGAQGAILAAWLLADAFVIDAADASQVAQAFQNALVLSPNDTRLWIGLAEATNDRSIERHAIMQALACDKNRSLDPLVQLSKDQRAVLEARLSSLP